MTEPVSPGPDRSRLLGRGIVQQLFAAALDGDVVAETRLRDLALVDDVADTAHAALLDRDLRAYQARHPDPAPSLDPSLDRGHGGGQRHDGCGGDLGGDLGGDAAPAHVVDQILAAIHDSTRPAPDPDTRA